MDGNSHLPGMVLCFGVGAWTYATSGHHDPNHASNCNRSFGNYGFDVCRISNLLRFKRLPVSTQRSYSGLKMLEADDSLAPQQGIKLQVIRLRNKAQPQSCRADQIHLLHSRLSF